MCVCISYTVSLVSHLLHVVRDLGALVDHRASALGHRLLSQQHGAHRGLVDDGVRWLFRLLGARERAHRAALLAVPERILEGELGGGDALDRTIAVVRMRLIGF